jgi:prophage maintenance system killer protein
VSVRIGERGASEGEAGQPLAIHVLSVDRVQEIYRALVAFLRECGDTAADLGLRGTSHLDLAVSHQFTSCIGPVGQSDSREKAAALVQGLFDERPFHDGNAQTAFICMLMHLSLNGLAPNKVPFDEFYRLFLAISEHKLDRLALGNSRIVANKKRGNADEGTELELIFQWLCAKTRKVDRQDFPLPLGELKRLLEAKGVLLDEVQDGTARFLELSREESQTEKRMFGLGTRTTSRATPFLRVPAPGADGLVATGALKDLLKGCGLDPADFYDFSARVGSLILQHRTLLPRLANL